MLTNHAYVGEFAFDGHLFPAEHEPIVDRESWELVQTILAEVDTPQHRRAWLLAGILRCAPCEADMTPIYGLRERQYLCLRIQNRTACASGLRAFEFEKFVIERLRAIGHDPKLLEAAVDEGFYSLAARQLEFRDQIRQARADLELAHAELRGQICDVGTGPPPHKARTAALKDRILQLQCRVAKMRREVDLLRTLRIRPEEFRAALAAFGHHWEHGTGAQRARLLRRFIERVNYQQEPGAGELTISFSLAGIHSLAAQHVTPGGASS